MTRRVPIVLDYALRPKRSLPLQFNAKHSKTGKKEAISFRGTATLPR